MDESELSTIFWTTWWLWTIGGAIIAGIIAARKRRSPIGWAVLGALFSLIAIIIVAILPALPDEEAERRERMETRQCPECAERIQREARRCKHCGATFDPMPPRKNAGRTERAADRVSRRFGS